MTREAFDKLVEKVEKGIGSDPAALHKRVAWLAVLGYSSLLAAFVVVISLGLAFIIPGILWPREALALLFIGGVILTAGLWVVCRTLWVRLPSPQGYVLSRSEAPGLYAMLDDLQSSLSSIPFDVLLITPEHNAGVVQRPRLGVFGWYKNYLLIGLPIMESLSCEELRAVLAHEFAHLSRRHGQSSQWIYRLRRSWEPVFANLSRPYVKREVSFRPLVVKWVDWFWPWFNAHAFVLSRTYEYQADAAAAQVVGNQLASLALARTILHGLALERKFWPELWQLAKTCPSPPPDTFCYLAQFLNGFCPEEQATYLEQALRSISTNADTHPSLSDRLRSLGWGSGQSGQILFDSVPPAPQTNAAQVFLGIALEKIRGALEASWRKTCQEAWHAQYVKSAAINERLDKLTQTIDKKDLDVLWDKAQMVAQLQKTETTEPLLKEILAANPNHAGANFQLGCLLLKSGRAEGEGHIDQALIQNPDWLPQAADALHSYFRLTGQSERIRELHVRLDRFEKEQVAARTERSNISSLDMFVSHNLLESELATVCAVLAADPEVMGAHLARKELRHITTQQLYALCLRIRRPWHRLPNATREERVIDRIAKAIRLPGRVLVFAPSGSYRSIASKLFHLANAEIFRR